MKDLSGLLKPFPVGCVMRVDLQRLGLAEEEIASLTDMDMLAIANSMQLKYLQGDFWRHLTISLDEVLQEKFQSQTGIQGISNTDINVGKADDQQETVSQV